MSEKPLGPIQNKSSWRQGEPPEHREACDIIVKYFLLKGLGVWQIFTDLYVWKISGFVNRGGKSGNFGGRSYYWLDILAQRRLKDPNLMETYWIEVDGSIHENPWYKSKDQKKETEVYMVLHKLDPYLVRFKVEELVKIKGVEPVIGHNFGKIATAIKARRHGFGIIKV